jgi:3-dehydro-4-phosphotetronate decarboxylase
LPFGITAWPRCQSMRQGGNEDAAMTETGIREEICRLGRSLFERGLTPGSSGNISTKLEDGGWLVTPTNASLGSLDPARLSRLDAQGRLVSGDAPTKEVPLHTALYQTRGSARAVVHLHSTHSVAVSCLAEIDPDDVLPPITAYYVMRVGRLPLVPYFRPGDMGLAEAVRGFAGKHHAVLLANHGPVVAGSSLDAAVNAIEELEETAKLYLLLRGAKTRFLTSAQVAELRE